MPSTNAQVVVLVALTAVVFSAPVIAAQSHYIRQPVHKHSDIHIHRRGIICVGEVSELLSQHEGRHHCAYDHKGGYRAVGCGYNLDDDVDQRRWELAEALSDYDRVYKGEVCLNDVQISGLLILDAKRALDRAGENVPTLHDLCCPVRAVFADIQHTSGPAENFPRQDMDRVIDRATSEDYKSAADQLEKTKWCSEDRNRQRCDDNLDLFERGC